METLVILGQRDPFQGQRRLASGVCLNGSLHMSEPSEVKPNSLWFSEKSGPFLGRTQIFIGRESYFDRNWPKELNQSSRYQISRALKKDLRFELKKKGEECPFEEMGELCLLWQKSKLFVLGYLLKPLPLKKTLDYDCAFLWRGERLVGFAPLLGSDHVLLTQNLYRHESCPNGALAFLVKSLIETYEKPVSLGLSPDIGFLPTGIRHALGLVYNFPGLSKSRQNLHPSREKEIFLNIPSDWSLYRLSLFLMVILLMD